MDQVNNLNMNSDGSQQAYNEKSTSSLDPNLLDNSQWKPSYDYQFQSHSPAPQQNPQYPASSYSYPVQQQSSYTQSPYTNQYHHQAYQQHVSPYGSSPYPLYQQSPIRHQQQSAATSSNQSIQPQYGYYTQAPPSATISPTSLHVHQYQSNDQQQNSVNARAQSASIPYSSQTWNQGSSQYYQQPQQTGAQSVQAQSYSAVPTPSASTPSSAIPPTPRPAQVKKVRPSSLRITNEELLKSRNEQNSVDLAPFVVLETRPVDYVISGKTDIPKHKPRKNRSGRDLVPGLVINNVEESHAKQQAKRDKAAIKKLQHRQISLSTPAISKDVKARVLSSGVAAVASPSATSDSSSEVESSSEEDSSDSEYEDAMPVELISEVRAETRPADPAEAAAWDVTGILWLDRFRHATKEEIINAVPKFQDYITKLRDDAKQATAAVTTAETEKQPASKIKSLIEMRDSKRHVLARALQSAVSTGHHHLLENLSNSQKLVMILASILSEAYKLEDYNGELPKAVLSLMVKFTSLTDSLLQKLKFDNTAKRFTKKGDAEVKDNFAKILGSTPESKESAKKALEKAQAEEAKKERIKNGIAIQERNRLREEAAKAAGAAGSKRAHDGDGSNGKPTKKIASETTAVNSVPKAVPAKVTPAARTTGLFATLKKPMPKPTPAPVKKPEPVKAPEPSTKQSSLADLLASINEPKAVVKAPVAVSRPTETAEQKAKRERKESRRHLRVRWKEASALEEIRLFRHEQAEDEGREGDMLRDAHDDRSEGLRLKQALEGVDIEDDDDLPYYGEVLVSAQYPELKSIDFSTLDEKSRSKNFITRGGNVTFRTPQQEVQENREKVEMMAFYVDPKDIPFSPKEPPFQSNDAGTTEYDIGRPTQDWLSQRVQDINNFGVDQALDMMAKRAFGHAFHEGVAHRPSAASTSPSPASPNVSAVNTTELANLISVCNSLSNKPFPAVEPPAWMPDDMKITWWAGFNRDMASKRALVEHQEAVRAQEVQAQAPQPPPPPPIAFPQIQNPFPLPEQYGFIPPPPPSMVAPPPLQNEGFHPDRLPLITQQGDWGQSHDGYNNSYDQYNRRNEFNDDNSGHAKKKKKRNHHDWDATGDNTSFGNDGSTDRYGRTGRTTRADLPPATMPPTKAELEYKGKKKPCKFFMEGKCAKGANCGFLHPDVD